MQSIAGKSEVDYIKCYKISVRKQNKNLAFGLTSFSALVALGFKRSKSSIQGGSRMAFSFWFTAVFELQSWSLR